MTFVEYPLVNRSRRGSPFVETVRSGWCIDTTYLPGVPRRIDDRYPPDRVRGAPQWKGVYRLVRGTDIASTGSTNRRPARLREPHASMTDEPDDVTIHAEQECRYRSDRDGSGNSTRAVCAVS